MRSESETFDTRNKDAKEASRRVEEFLRSCVKVINVENVENVREYQNQDIDLLCTLEARSGRAIVSIEIKGDTKAHQTGNFFFETISNASLKTQGCFLKSQADLLFYYLMEKDCLYIFPTKKVQYWFVMTQEQLSAESPEQYEKIFQLKKTHTVNAAGGYQHTTIGRCVSIEYTKNSLSESKIPFKEIEEMGRWRCNLEDFCLEAI